MVRRPLSYILGLCVLLVSASCSGTGQAGDRQTDSSSVVNVDPTIPLRDQLLRLPGVYLSQQGDIRIRGASGPPLYVVDGMETTGDPLSFMSASDVERMEVLKGPETAMYGVRGGRGVVLITTRRGPEPADQ